MWLGVNSNASALYFFTIAKIHAFYSLNSPHALAELFPTHKKVKS